MLSVFLDFVKFASLIALPVSFVVFLIGGRIGGRQIFWPTLLAYVIVNVALTFGMAALLGQSLTDYLASIMPEAIIQTVIVIIALGTGAELWTAQAKKQDDAS